MIDSGSLNTRFSGDPDPDTLVACLAARAPTSDAEALRLLREAFPATALIERVQAVGRWRRRL